MDKTLLTIVNSNNNSPSKLDFVKYTKQDVINVIEENKRLKSKLMSSTIGITKPLSSNEEEKEETTPIETEEKEETTPIETQEKEKSIHKRTALYNAVFTANSESLFTKEDGIKCDKALSSTIQKLLDANKEHDKKGNTNNKEGMDIACTIFKLLQEKKELDRKEKELVIKKEKEAYAQMISTIPKHSPKEEDDLFERARYVVLTSLLISEDENDRLVEPLDTLIIPTDQLLICFAFMYACLYNFMSKFGIMATAALFLLPIAIIESSTCGHIYRMMLIVGYSVYGIFILSFFAFMCSDTFKLSSPVKDDDDNKQSLTKISLPHVEPNDQRMKTVLKTTKSTSVNNNNPDECKENNKEKVSQSMNTLVQAHPTIKYLIISWIFRLIMVMMVSQVIISVTFMIIFGSSVGGDLCKWLFGNGIGDFISFIVFHE